MLCSCCSFYLSRCESRFQIIMLKCRCHAVDLAFGETMSCGFGAPLRDGLTDLFCYVARFAIVQFEIPRNLHCQRERGRVVVFELDDGKARDIAKQDRKSTRLNSSHLVISYAVFCLKKKKK